MRQVRVMIAGAEKQSSRALGAQLASRPDVALVAEAGNGAAALAAVEETGADIVFIDLRLPPADTCMLLERVAAQSRTAVIFLSRPEEQAFRAFEVTPIEPALAAHNRGPLRDLLGPARNRTADDPAAGTRCTGDRAAGARQYSRRLLVRRGGRARFVPTEDIDWIEAFGNNVRLHVGAATHLMNVAIGELEDRLDATQFMRIHRSHIVNLDRIGHIEPCGGSDYQVVLLDGTPLRVSRSSRDRLLRPTL